MPEAGHFIRFGRYSAIPHTRALLADGQAIEIGARVFDVLMALIETRGAVVSQEEIARRVWPNTAIEASNVRVQVAKLRRALEPDRDMIKTVAGRGYFFAASVEVEPVEGLSRDRQAIDVSTKTNLPRPGDRLIGREGDLAALERRIGTHRLVTITGIGGMGKTRLAVELGRRVASGFPDGVWLIDLTPLTAPEIIAGATANILGVNAPNMATVVEAIAATLDSRRTLLIFDNCEHLLEGLREFIESLLARTATLVILATSRERIQATGEQRYPLRPLAGIDAVTLFAARARTGYAPFVLDDGNTASVAEICRRLEGIPLALEMAAARVALLGIEQLRAALDQRLRLLKTTDEPRYQTLGGMVAWSYGLLTQTDQRIFRALGIFPGGFHLEAAVAMADGEWDQWQVLDALGRLLDKSLMIVEDREPRQYRLLETLRLFALERLDEAGERTVLAERHALYFARLLDHADDCFETMQHEAWRKIYQPHLDNIRAALDWAFAKPDRAALAVRLATTGVRVFASANLSGEGRVYAQRGAKLIDADTPGPVAADGLMLTASMLRDTDPVQAIVIAERAVALYRQDSRPLRLGRALSILGLIYTFTGRYPEAETIFQEAEAILSGSPWKKAYLTLASHLGVFYSYVRKPEDSRRWYSYALDLAREISDTDREDMILMALGEVEFALGSAESAIALARQALQNCRSRGIQRILSTGVMNLASYLVPLGELAEVKILATEALSLTEGQTGITTMACLNLWSLLAASEGDYELSAKLMGFVDAQDSAPLGPTEQMICDRRRDLLDANLSADALRGQTAIGTLWSRSLAISTIRQRLLA